MQEWKSKIESNKLLKTELNLSDLFHPNTFLNALRQQTARNDKNLQMDQLKLVCSWKNIPSSNLSVNVCFINLCFLAVCYLFYYKKYIYLSKHEALLFKENILRNLEVFNY